MKKLISVLLLYIFTAGPALAWNPFKGLIKAELSAVKNEFQGKVTGIENAIVDVKSEMTGVKGDMSGIKGDISFVKGKLNNTMSAIAGVNNKIEKTSTEQTAGRDIKTNSSKRIINDPKVLIAISGSLFTFMGTLSGGLFLIIRSKDKQISKLMTELMGHQQKFMNQQEVGQQKYISMLEKIAMTFIDDKLKTEVTK